MGNTTERQDEISTAPIEYEDISLFNPQDGFASFLIPAVLILIIQQTLLLGIGLQQEPPVRITASKTWSPSAGSIRVRSAL